jgi:hypothetical protein
MYDSLLDEGHELRHSLQPTRLSAAARPAVAFAHLAPIRGGGSIA